MREEPVPHDLPGDGSQRRFAFSIPEALDTRSKLAGAIALVAYDLSSRGTLYVQGRQRTKSLERWVSYVDIYAALGVGRRYEAIGRYPGRVQPVGTDGAVVTTIHRD